MAFADRLIAVAKEPPASFFDDKFEVMKSGNHEPGVWEFCYERQIKYLKGIARPGSVVIDVGCGPEPVYGPQNDWYLVGVDPSLQSLRANSTMNLRIFGNAQKLPLAAESADIVTCFYSVHHMVGEYVSATRTNVSEAMREFHRVLRPGGSILVFDMSPWWPAWVSELALWNSARKVLGKRLDMFFWHWKALGKIASEQLNNCTFTTQLFRSSWMTMFPPIFSLPWLKVPRALYPLEPRVYHWTKRA